MFVSLVECNYAIPSSIKWFGLVWLHCWQNFDRLLVYIYICFIHQYKSILLIYNNIDNLHPCFLYRFEHREHVVHVYGDQSIAEALHALWKSRTGVIAVTDRENKRVIGSVRNSDVYLLLESGNLLHNKKY